MAQTALDIRYFNDDAWSVRARDWVAADPDPFVAAHAAVVRAVVGWEGANVQVVVNLGPTAMLALLAGEPYVNLYERPLVGGVRREPSRTREQVDAALDLVGKDTYFAALAIGGVGVRFYGEYCVVLDVAQIDGDPGLFDRDSYEIVFPPFAGRPDLARLVGQMSATWDERVDVLVLKVLPTVTSRHRKVTAAVVADAVLGDQDFVEVHLHPDRRATDRGCFVLDAVTEIRRAAVDLTLADWLESRRHAGEMLTDEELLFLRQREDVAAGLARTRTPVTVAGAAAGGYGWT